MKHVCKHPSRQGPHVRTAIAYLKALGATAIAVMRSKCLRLHWRLRDRDFAISLQSASHPGRHAADFATQAIRRALRAAGIAVPALA